MAIIYSTCSFVQKSLLGLFADYTVSGLENVPPMGPLVVVSNHSSYIDPSLLAVSFNRRLRFLAKKDLFVGWPINSLLESYGAHPVNRGKADVEAYRWAGEQLSRDRALVVFPEGTRNNGRLIKAKTGATRLVIDTRAPLIPVGITGSERLGSMLRLISPTGRIHVNIGPIFSLPYVEGNLSKEVVTSFTDIIMDRIARLLPKSYQGVYS